MVAQNDRRGQKKVAPAIEPAKIVERFVLRARRVAAHSLSQSRDRLQAFANTMIRGNIDLAGRFTVVEDLPDEETFESLVARLRPLTVESEPIFYNRVLDAITALTTGVATASDRQRVTALRVAWESTEIQGTQVQGYTVQAVRPDQVPTSIVSDTQLAAGWLYADLVHADPRGAKVAALEHDLKDRYTAAVRVFSRIAMLTLDTLDLVRDLQERSLIMLPDDAWTAAVSVHESESPIDVRVFYADVGTAVPDLAEGSDLPTAWSRFTVADLFLQDPANQVSLTLQTGDEQTNLEAAIMHRRPEEGGVEWDIFVDGCLILTFAFSFENDRAVTCTLAEEKYLELTNAQKLRSTQLARRLHAADRAVFDVPGGNITISMEDLSAEEELQMRVIEEALSDVIEIEKITGNEIGVCDGRFTDLERVRLRQTRLIWEGKVVHARLKSATVTSPSGNPPQVIAIKEGSIAFAGQQIPTPETHLWHQQLEVHPITATDSPGRPREYIMSPPQGEHLVAWAPALLVSSDNKPVLASPWDLTGIDEKSFL